MRAVSHITFHSILPVSDHHHGPTSAAICTIWFDTEELHTALSSSKKQRRQPLMQLSIPESGVNYISQILERQ